MTKVFASFGDNLSRKSQSFVHQILRKKKNLKRKSTRWSVNQTNKEQSAFRQIFFLSASFLYYFSRRGGRQVINYFWPFRGQKKKKKWVILITKLGKLSSVLLSERLTNSNPFKSLSVWPRFLFSRVSVFACGAPKE